MRGAKRVVTAATAAAQRLRPGALSRPVLPGLAAVLVAVSMVSALVAVGATGSSAAEPDARAPVPARGAAECGPGWATAWQTGAQPARAEALGGHTLRMVVHPQVTGTQVRVRLSNRYGTKPLEVARTSAGWSDGGAGLVPGTARPVGFAGSDSVLVPPGQDVLSDPVAVVAEAGRPLAVSMFLPGRPDVLTGHGVALQTSYVSRPGDFALAPDRMAYDTEVRSWFVLTGVDVLAPRTVNALVATGDSITDGVGSAVDADERWSDALSSRLGQLGGAAVMSVLNAGISRNQLLSDRPDVNGDSPLTRFDRDVAAAAGATGVVLHVGTNDIAVGRSAAEIIDGYVRYTELAREAGRSVLPDDHHPVRPGRPRDARGRWPSATP